MAPNSIGPLLFLLFASSTPALATVLSTNTSNAVDNFVQCFLALTHFSASHILITTATSPSLYQSTLVSSAQNSRFLASASTRLPAIIAVPEEEWHVSVIVQCAYSYDLQLRVRSGGHDPEGASYAATDDDKAAAYAPFVDIDLARLRKIDVDAGNRIAWVQAGATLGELAYTVFTNTSSLAGFPMGSGRTVGVGGFISSGGIGPMSRNFGTAADNVVDAKMVTTCGAILDRAAMGEELFWAIRGGGAASFGVVLAYKIKLVDVPNLVYTFNLTRDILTGNNLRQDTIQTLTRWQEVAPQLDDGVFLQAVIVATVGISGVINIQVVFFCFSFVSRTPLVNTLSNVFPELGVQRQDLKKRDWLDAILAINGMSGKSKEDLLNRTQEFPATSFKTKSDFVATPITAAQWGAIFRSLNSTLSAQVLQDQRPVTVTMTLHPMGGKMSEFSDAAIPFPHRRGNLYFVQYLTRWFAFNEQTTRKHLDLMRNISSFMTPFVSANPRAAYYGYKDTDLGKNMGALPSYPEAKAWGERYFKGNFERLARIKREVDAGNYLRNEQSIPPYSSRPGGSDTAPPGPPTPPPPAPALNVFLQCSPSACVCFTNQ